MQLLKYLQNLLINGIKIDMWNNIRTFAPVMETKIETTNAGGKVLVLDGEKLVGLLEFTFEGNVMSIEHTYAYKKGMGVGGALVGAANNYAVSKGLKVLPVCSFAAAWYERHPQFTDILIKEGD
jgi:predicted GNAT family acetyltransferase